MPKDHFESAKLHHLDGTQWPCGLPQLLGLDFSGSSEGWNAPFKVGMFTGESGR